ncbi:uncharacterized protein LAJ45_01564 [Morchella importuna]|uniref:uncharacterized protein n=1 Tax=Morchella importuna TaxID=1174673 RepID=UPI001E8CCB55|nr:uncharacterized protein LAJ45_01564 [Morchella importuna]KAH8153797.1 hypothetical protein LAJ45_01564 [Morchella importuna]
MEGLYKPSITSKALPAAPAGNSSTAGPGELNAFSSVSQSSVSGILGVERICSSQVPGFQTGQHSTNNPKDRSPMSQACESSVIPGCHPVKYINKGEMFTEHSLCPDPPGHASRSLSGKDKSFVGVVSAINALNLSMNASRLTSIDLASSLETYAAVIHSRTNSSTQAEMNEACANCFDHTAVFWMEWAAIQAKIQVSLIEDLYKLKVLATSIENGSGSTADTIDVDSIRAVTVKLTKTSHESFKEAYEKGAGWSSVGGLDYWTKKLPEPVIKEAPTINTHSESINRLPTAFGTARVFAETKIDRQFALSKESNNELLENKHSNESFNTQKLGARTNSSDTLCSLGDNECQPGFCEEKGIFEIDTDGAVRRKNERSVHSFKYPNGRANRDALPSVTNRRSALPRSSDIINLDNIYSGAINKSNNNLQAAADLKTTLEETDSEDEVLLNKRDSSNAQKESRTEQDNDDSHMGDESAQDKGKCVQEYAVQGNTVQEDTVNMETSYWDNLPSAYLYRPLSYAITEEGSIRTTPPKGQISPAAAVGHEASHRSGIPAAAVKRPGNIRRKGKFHKQDGSILMLSKREADDSSSDDDTAKGSSSNTQSGGVGPSEEPGKKPATTTNGGQNLIPPKLQHIEIPFFDRGTGPTAVAQPLEPNYNYPDQYPSRGYFSEDFSPQQKEDLTLEATKSLQADNGNQNTPGWANRFKKILKFPRGSSDQTSLLSPTGLKRQLSPDPENPMFPNAKQKKPNV